MNRQLLHGLFVASDLSLGDEVAPGGVDFTLVSRGQRRVNHEMPSGNVLQATRYNDQPLYSTAQQEDGSYLLRLHGAVDFQISEDLTLVEAYADPNCPRELLELLASGNLLATRAVLMGELVLHASAVALGSGSLAFVAPSGVGKSTMSTLCCLQGGASFVTDDVLRLDLRGPEVLAWRGLREARLRRDLADLATTAPRPTRQTVDGRTAWEPERSTQLQTSLRAIVLPEPDRSRPRLRLERVLGGQAVLALACAPRILDWRRGRELEMGLLAMSRLVERVPVYRARIPWGPPFSQETAQELVELVAADRSESPHCSGSAT